MGRPDFDKPTKNSLTEAKEYWEEHKQFQIEMMNDPENISSPEYDKEHYLQEIKNADENLADILPRLAEFD